MRPGIYGDVTPADAGFLYGVGLNGLLGRLNKYTIHELLTRRLPHAAVATLLGIAASRIGTGDEEVCSACFFSAANHSPS